MRTVKTAYDLAQDRDRGYGKITDLKNRREALIVWDETQEQTLAATFKIILKDSKGNNVDAVFNKDNFQKLIRWA